MGKLFDHKLCTFRSGKIFQIVLSRYWETDLSEKFFSKGKINDTISFVELLFYFFYLPCSFRLWKFLRNLRQIVYPYLWNFSNDDFETYENISPVSYLSPPTIRFFNKCKLLERLENCQARRWEIFFSSQIYFLYENFSLFQTRSSRIGPVTPREMQPLVSNHPLVTHPAVPDPFSLHWLLAKKKKKKYIYFLSLSFSSSSRLKTRDTRTRSLSLFILFHLEFLIHKSTN